MTRKLFIVCAAAGAFAVSALPAFAQDQGGEHMHHGHICANAKLSDDDKAACSKAMKDAKTKEDRTQVRDTYEAKIKDSGGDGTSGSGQ
jgi:hypothetical protein